MTDTTTPAELEIPAEALDAHMRNHWPAGLRRREEVDWAGVERVVRDSALPVVAAELRRLADECYREAFNVMGNRLSRRADELDPQP